MDNKICIVPTLSALHALQNHEKGECVYCEEDNKIYSWQEDNGWSSIDIQNKGISMNLYELNQSIINQLPPLTSSEIAAKMDIIHKIQNNTMNNHYMLLCKEYSYYTIFESDIMLNMPTFGAAVCEVVSGIGDVYSIEITDNDNALEIWIKPEGQENALAFYLFPYDAGVVYYG